MNADPFFPKKDLSHGIKLNVGRDQEKDRQKHYKADQGENQIDSSFQVQIGGMDSSSAFSFREIDCRRIF